MQNTRDVNGFARLKVMTAIFELEKRGEARTSKNIAKLVYKSENLVCGLLHRYVFKYRFLRRRMINRFVLVENKELRGNIAGCSYYYKPTPKGRKDFERLKQRFGTIDLN